MAALEQLLIAAFIAVCQPLTTAFELLFLLNHLLYRRLGKQLTLDFGQSCVLLNARRLNWVIYFMLFYFFLVYFFAFSLFELLCLKKLLKADNVLFFETFLSSGKYFLPDRIGSGSWISPGIIVENGFSFLRWNKVKWYWFDYWT
jgi:hypothetical protein